MDCSSRLAADGDQDFEEGTSLLNYRTRRAIAISRTEITKEANKNPRNRGDEKNFTCL